MAGYFPLAPLIPSDVPVIPAIGVPMIAGFRSAVPLKERKTGNLHETLPSFPESMDPGWSGRLLSDLQSETQRTPHTHSALPFPRT